MNGRILSRSAKTRLSPHSISKDQPCLTVADYITSSVADAALVRLPTRGRHPSTIYRELKRNRHYDEEPFYRGYFPVTAQTKASARRVRAGKIIRRVELAAYVIARLQPRLEAYSGLSA